MSKHFLVNPYVGTTDKKVISKLNKEKEKTLKDNYEKRVVLNEQVIQSDDNLISVPDKVIVKIDDKSKDYHVLNNGLRIEKPRRFNNLNTRETNPVNAIVISSSYIPKGSEILVHPNEIHDSNKIFDYKNNTGDVGYFSIKEDQCFAYFDEGEWKPLKGFDFSYRVYEPYFGSLEGIEPKLIKDTLYVYTGKYSGKIVKTIVACDYQIVAQGKDGREINIIRFRPDGCQRTKREPEAIAIMNELTTKLKIGKLYIGLTPSDAKPLNVPNN